MSNWRVSTKFLIFLASYFQTACLLGRNIDPALHYSTAELITAAGYPAQEYNVTTDDGYILGLFRIAENSSKTSDRPPVLLMHGMTSCSDSWLMQGPKKDLAYLLYDAGYDVWMGDVRGNFYSRRHVSLPPSSPQFWQFSFHEMGVHDLPAFLDFIIRTTGHPQITYVGHSMGTTAFFIMGSEKQELMSKIRLFVAMAPVAAMYPNNIPPDKRVLLNFVSNLLESFKSKGIYEIIPRVPYAPFLATLFCREGSLTQDLCYDSVFFWAGSQAKRISRKSLPMILSHTPAGLSIDTPAHYLQIMNAGRFQQMDFGSDNIKRYGVPSPPEYNISRVTCPVAAHFSLGDYLINATDVRINLKLLPNIVDSQEYKDLNHIDFVWGRSAWQEVYPSVINIIDKLNNDLR